MKVSILLAKSNHAETGPDGDLLTVLTDRPACCCSSGFGCSFTLEEKEENGFIKPIRGAPGNQSCLCQRERRRRTEGEEQKERERKREREGTL